MPIITPESWHLNWPLQEVVVQFLRTGTISQVEQSTICVKRIGQEGQREKLRPNVANVSVNLCCPHLLQ